MLIEYFLDKSLRTFENGEFNFIFTTSTKAELPKNVDLFSGILDSQGNKIYENDIVSFNDKKGVIIFKDGVFWVMWGNFKNKKELYKIKKCVVIGNTYQQVKD